MSILGNSPNSNSSSRNWNNKNRRDNSKMAKEIRMFMVSSQIHRQFQLGLKGVVWSNMNRRKVWKNK